MNLLNSQNQNQHTNHPSLKLHHKKRLSQDQVRLLESSFDASKKLEPERKFQLARELGVPTRQIAIWYQNKRARWKNQSLELDHGALQVRLEAALAEKRELQKVVSSLRSELKQTQNMLFGLQQAQAQAQQGCVSLGLVDGPHAVSSLSSCCDEADGSSTLNNDVGCSGNWGNGNDIAALQYEELYACLMMQGATKGSNSCAPFPNAFVNNERDYWP